jgi:hypothetical protein
MTHYHIRYNVYEQEGFPVEKERWVIFDGPVDDTHLRQHLEKEHSDMVSIILSKQISKEEFEGNHPSVENANA